MSRTEKAIDTAYGLISGPRVTTFVGNLGEGRLAALAEVGRITPPALGHEALKAMRFSAAQGMGLTKGVLRLTGLVPPIEVFDPDNPFDRLELIERGITLNQYRFTWTKQGVKVGEEYYKRRWNPNARAVDSVKGMPPKPSLAMLEDYAEMMRERGIDDNRYIEDVISNVHAQLPESVLEFMDDDMHELAALDLHSMTSKG